MMAGDKRRFARLTGGQIALLRNLAVRCGLGGLVSVNRWQRSIALALWRRGLIEIWYRQAVEDTLQGPYFGLSVAGRRLALVFTAPRAARAAHGG
jgi:hypothetical protein